ncbi:carbohydrate ABC transporter membrane protein 1, CUT1 family [Saccharopolyspora kobensis]|uniref:Carbohydrate ABC transporter membrane protein 1, CUT1 family n=2 Tax=Saccharopolyspora kobensis TaxID=146035 RepID=A0ABY1E636_9PSEU|nr:sugar ABC transporter permease [Saccharopolyspora kobensis]SFE95287.1 carbohydrate ABC transporter membrane protein 1, CUT1 family [Saccharopolyspora kobensis]
MTATHTRPAPGTAGRPAVPGARRRPRMTVSLPYLLMAPAVLALVVLLGWPAVNVIITSFRKLDLGELTRGEVVWAGFDNYAQILTGSDFWVIALRTVVFTAAMVGATVVIALLLALLMNHIPVVPRVVLQISLLLAWAMPQLAATTVFQWIFDQQFGILNKTLVLLGFDSFEGASWFASGTSTLTVVGILIVWQAVPFVAMTLYAALLSVPKDLYESAGIDGANGWQTFSSITWPHLKPVLMIVTFLSILWDFKVFSQVWAVREGGPNGESTTLPVLQYLEGIAGKHFGVAAAVSVLMVIVLVIVCAQYLRLLLRSQEGEL